MRKTVVHNDPSNKNTQARENATIIVSEVVILGAQAPTVDDTPTSSTAS